MSKTVTLKEGDTEIYPVTSAEAEFSYGVLKVKIWGFNYA